MCCVVCVVLSEFAAHFLNAARVVNLIKLFS